MTTELRIQTVSDDKRRFMDLLLIGDEQESMIDRYLDRGTLYVGTMAGVAVCVCVVTRESSDTVEIKNIAVHPEYRRSCIGHRMLGFIEMVYKGHNIQLGTGETPSTLRFYRKAGYEYSHRIEGFFTTNYDHPIIEEGVVLSDMIYLVKKCSSSS